MRVEGGNYEGPPLPVQPLEYGGGVRSSRPKMISIIAITSIVIGAIGLLIGGLLSLYASSFMVMAVMARNSVVATNTTTTASGTGPVAVQTPATTTVGAAVPAPVSAATLPSTAPSFNLAQAAITRIEALSATKLDAGQVKDLTNALNGINQQILTGTGPTAVSQIYNAVAQPNGTINFFTQTASVTLLPGGGITVSSFGSGVGSTPFNRLSPWHAGGAMLHSLGSLALAIYLLIVGIFTLRGSIRGRTLHRIFIVLKILVVIAGVWAWNGIAQMFMTDVLSSGGGGGGDAVKVMLWTCGVVSTGFIYPIALIFMLRTKDVRDFYQMPDDAPGPV
jgi:hypothetical protein